MVSHAKRFCDNFTRLKDKKAAMAKLQLMCVSRKKIGDDVLYTMSDYSTILHRLLFDELTIYNDRVLEITEEMARVALKLHPHIVAEMSLTTRQAEIYKLIVDKDCKIIGDVAKAMSISRRTAWSELNVLYEKNYLDRKIKGVCKSGGQQWVYSQKLNCY